MDKEEDKDEILETVEDRRGRGFNDGGEKNEMEDGRKSEDGKRVRKKRGELNEPDYLSITEKALIHDHSKQNRIQTRRQTARQNIEQNIITDELHNDEEEIDEIEERNDSPDKNCDSEKEDEEENEQDISSDIRPDL
ncbi:YTH domain-containing protein 1-like [Formica exsecta]|uniref:YTH domain-containing protein 1-like n=1 Tax=Formica exsecta TaxID=72781 RepID=UPI001144F1D7|nr:YTH domain-containing protein 1-like [Formica exsecta]